MSGCQVLSSGLRRALGEERHFTLVDGFALPTAGFCTGKNTAFPFFGRLVSVVRDGGHQSLQVYRGRSRAGLSSCLPEPLDSHSRVKLRFVTQVGAIHGSVEMLRPVSPDLQPFPLQGTRCTRSAEAESNHSITLGSEQRWRRVDSQESRRASLWDFFR